VSSFETYVAGFPTLDRAAEGFTAVVFHGDCEIESVVAANEEYTSLPAPGPLGDLRVMVVPAWVGAVIEYDLGVLWAITQVVAMAEQSELRAMTHGQLSDTVTFEPSDIAAALVAAFADADDYSEEYAVCGLVDAVATVAKRRGVTLATAFELAPSELTESDLDDLDAVLAAAAA
jgi:hypothetical protein